jgi:hypothetical protein
MYATIKNISSGFNYETIILHIETVGPEKYVDYYINRNVRLDQHPKLTLDVFLKRNNIEIVKEFERVI